MFRRAKVGSFFQSKPKLSNPYLNDGFFQRVLKRILPSEAFQEINVDLTRLGSRVVNQVELHGDRCELNEPYLVQFDPWGNRIDQVVTDPSWTALKYIAADEGLVSIGYERKFEEFSRLYQFSKIYLYTPSSGLWSCPLAMTDGAAKVLTDLVDTTNTQNPIFLNAIQRLTSRNPAEFWSSGQWMTERKGGSDVGSGTETVAIQQADNPDQYKLYGYKWFTSATDADMTLTLARIQSPDSKQTTAGSKGLSMFYLQTRLPPEKDDEDERLNNIQIVRLKNKLGTRQLPTGELLLDGTLATLVSEPGRGVASIAGMLSVTRLHNAVASIAGMRRILMLLRDYSCRRECFGSKINTMPLHLNTLSNMEMYTRAGTLFVMELSRLFGSTEVLQDEQAEGLFRLLTPIGKLYFGKVCMSVISEGVEGFGGNGYIEDTGIPRLLRDAQVTPIWEGTTNILSLDVLRAISKSNGQVLVLLQDYISQKLDDGPHGSKLKKLLKDIQEVVLKGQLNPTVAREFAFALAEVTIGALLLEHSNSTFANASDHLTTQMWINQLVPLSLRLQNNVIQDVSALNELVYDSYSVDS